MLISTLIHPEILKVIAKCGHGDKVLIADGNFPLDSSVNKNTEKVYLALAPDLPTAPDVLKALKSQINFEKAEVMAIEPGEEPTTYKEFREILFMDKLTTVAHQDFLNLCKESENIKLAINTGETRTFSNILLTVGIR